MNVFLVIVLVLLVLALINISSSRKISAKKSQHRARDAKKRHTEKPAAPAPAAAPPKTQTAEAQRKSFLESYPSLIEVSYREVPENVAPKLLQDLSPEAIETVKERTASIKPIPVSYLKLMNLLRNPESNPGEITSVTVTNPVFSARILRAVNSAYYNRPEKITSVGRAISLLGYNNVRALVLQETLNNVIPKVQSGSSDTYNKTWAHSAVVSVCSGHLGKNMFQFSEYELGTMGLFHDIGKYFIHMLTPTGEAQAEALFMIQEEERYGTNHACLGSLIAGNWQLSESIVKCIEYHHYPAFFPPEAIPEPYRKQVFVIYLSDLICKALGYTADSEEKLPIRSEYYEMFKMHPDLQDNVAPRLIKEIEKTHQTVESYIHTP
ncbi:MAG TPA: HDOD domain-containing protein [Syntrophales bacterium]|nr:HDOD domain-containing protein [Syntrophales bacterium]